MTGVRMSIDGLQLKALDQALGELPKATARNVLLRTLEKAAEPIRDTAQRLAPDDPKTPDPDLESQIIVSRRRKTGRGAPQRRHGDNAATIFIGPNATIGAKSITGEFGSAPHNVARAARSKGRGKSRATGVKMHPGHPAQPFMRPAFEQHWREALDAIASGLRVEIDKARQRMARKAARRAAKGGR